MTNGGKVRSYKDILEVIACPECHKPVAEGRDVLACTGCYRTYPIVDGTPVLLNSVCLGSHQQQRAGSSKVQQRAGRVGIRRMFSHFIRLAAPPEAARFDGSLEHLGIKNYHVRVRDFISGFAKGTLVLDLGSGGRLVGDGVITMDLNAQQNLSLVADGQRLPFEDQSLDGVVVQQVLEHVPDPRQVVHEIHRVLKPGGRVYCDSPFIYPLHGKATYSDYWRFTVAGLHVLFNEFQVLESGECMGPSSALSVVLRSFLYSVCDRRLQRGVGRLVFGWLFSPINRLDALVARNGPYSKASAAVYYIGRKNGGHVGGTN